jgi:hypothetical protein
MNNVNNFKIDQDYMKATMQKFLDEVTESLKMANSSQYDLKLNQKQINEELQIRSYENAK